MKKSSKDEGGVPDWAGYITWGIMLVGVLLMKMILPAIQRLEKRYGCSILISKWTENKNA